MEKRGSPYSSPYRWWQQIWDGKWYSLPAPGLQGYTSACQLRWAWSFFWIMNRLAISVESTCVTTLHNTQLWTPIWTLDPFHRPIPLIWTHFQDTSCISHLYDPSLLCFWTSDPTLTPVISSLLYFLYKYCFTLPYLFFPAFPSVMPVCFVLLISKIPGLLSDSIGLSLYVHNTFWTWKVLCSLFVQTSNYISRTNSCMLP